MDFKAPEIPRPLSADNIVAIIITITITITIIYVMEVGHLLTRSGLTYPEVSS